MIERSYLQQVKKRIEEPRKFLQVLVGPRQIGKSTLINQLLNQISLPYISASADALGETNEVWLSQIWERARLQMQAINAKEFLLVIDEIQKIANWCEIVKLNWDKDSIDGINLKVILLGSSRLLIQKGLTESLTGRFEVLLMGHWTFGEMQSAFGWNIQQYIYFGGYPGSASLIDDENRWKSYIRDSMVETIVSKDILMLTRVDKPAILRRLFELGSLYSGQILSLTKLIGELQDAGNTTTLSNYLKLLYESGLLGGIEKFANNEIRKRASIPKFQVFNNALMTAQTGYKFNDIRLDPKEWSRLVESSVGAHLINHSVTERFKLYYWRDRNDEVDFILEQYGKIIGLEVKSGRRGETKGMTVFNERYRPNKIFLVGTGGIPIEEFLKINPIQFF